ncbi:MAG: ABC transporter permease [Pseudonocardiales bacterium]|nr:MAG: ABC transporter permease [Pseudonocardiales bacterium]
MAAVMLAPALIVIVGVALIPVLVTIYLSFHDASVASTGSFTGLANYRALLNDPDFTTAARNTAVFTVVSVVLEFALGLASALTLHRHFAGRGLTRAAVLVPWAFPVVVSALMWRLMLQDQIGIVAYIAKKLDVSSGSILSDQASLMIASIGVDVWKTTPFMTLLLLAGLQTIPSEVIDAARIDGAGAVKNFWYITMPLLRSTILVALLFRTLEAWSVYDLFWVMSDQQLESLSTYVYKAVRISELNFAPGTAAAVLIFVSSIVIALSFLWLMHKDADE